MARMSSLSPVVDGVLRCCEEVEGYVAARHCAEEACVGRTRHSFQRRECVSACQLIVRLRDTCHAIFPRWRSGMIAPQQRQPCKE